MKQINGQQQTLITSVQFLEELYLLLILMRRQGLLNREELGP
jgi:hypothetical protein